MQTQETLNRHNAAPALIVKDSVLIKKRKAQWLISGMLCLSLVIAVLGIYTSTRTESVSVTGYTSGIILVAAIVFLSFGIISSFLCLVVDGVFILLNIDMRPMKAGRCQFYASGNSYIYENYYATVPCQGLTETCSMNVRSGTCYCCDLYDCANGGYLNNYYEFVGVQSCQDVLSLYVLLWVLTTLNLLAFVSGILTTAVLGSVKDMGVPAFNTQHAKHSKQRSLGVCPDVPQWGGSSLSSFKRGNCSSPTAPLLMNPSSNSGQQLYPTALLSVSPAAGVADVSQTGLSDGSHTQPNPPPSAPLYNLLPYKTSSFA
nr:transmembrane protein 255B isoform X4 [Misgurnus anguillicaudatus]